MTVIMITALFGCKKKDKEADARLITPEATPTPAVTMEDLFEVQKKNASKYTGLVSAVLKGGDVTLPEINAAVGLGLKFNADIMDGLYGGNADLEDNLEITSSDNIAHIIMNYVSQ